MRSILRLQLLLLLLCFSCISFSQIIQTVSNCGITGWQRDISNTTGSATVTNGPGFPPYSIGSAELSVGADFNGVVSYGTGLYAGVSPFGITELSYWTYTSNFSGKTIYLILNIDVNGDGIFDLESGDDQLIFDPSFQGPFATQFVQPNVWQQWNALNGGWWSYQGTAGAINAFNVQPFFTIVASYSAAARLANGNSIRMAAGFGDPHWQMFTGNADGFSIETTISPRTIYDFELCNLTTDSDGDGVPDENDCAPFDAHVSSPVTYYLDSDNDGYGDPANSITVCSVILPSGYVSNNTDCDDHNAAVHPGAPEVCNGIDDDCDGLVDEEGPNAYYKDADGDGFGNPLAEIHSCGATPPPGYVTDHTDCNDNNANAHPGAPEICNGIDDNCDGFVDEGFLVYSYYQDKDGDGYGRDQAAPFKSCSPTPPPGFVADHSDCNDNNAKVHPGGPEFCGNGIDDDCDGLIDEGNTYYKDADGDGYGQPLASIQSCNTIAPPGYANNNTDCNDNNAAIHPGATEVCDGVDNNCNGLIDEGSGRFYRDQDGDGYGDPVNSVQACSAPAGYVADNTDCNDNNATVHPGAIERCGDGIDNDCNGVIDDGIMPTANAGPDKTVYYAGAGNVYPGYPACATLTASGSGGSGLYTYQWSTGATTQSITVCPAVTTTYTVTVTGANGCKGTDQVTVFVTDVRCGDKKDKITVCHSGNEICVSPNAVQAHLNHGDILGSCAAILTKAMKTEKNENALPPVYSLSSFPNPFASMTSIQYGLPVDSRITLKLYDQMGREIRVLVTGDKKAGNYSVSFDGSKLSTGVYYYKLIAVSAKTEVEKVEKTVIIR